MNTTHRSGLSAKSHPLYHLRAASIIIALIGFVLNFISLSTAYNTAPFPISIILEAITLLYCFHDLASYAAAKAVLVVTQLSIPPPATSSRSSRCRTAIKTDEPKWPTKCQIFVDFVLASLFQLLFWFELCFIIATNTSYGYYDSAGRETLQAYANLTNLLLSILHGMVCWKEIMARKQQAWLREHSNSPCDSCGKDKNAAGDEEEVDGAQPGPTLFGHIGHGKISMPRWARGPNARVESDDEESIVGQAQSGHRSHEQVSLLVTPDESATEVGGPSNYGTLDKSTDSVGSVPETVVKKKDKGKKRMVEVEE